MKIRSRMIFFSASLLLFPAALIALLAYTLYHRLQWDLLRGDGPGGVWRLLTEHYAPILGAVVVFAIVLTLITGAIFLRSLLRPLKQLRRIAQEIENGNLDVEICHDLQDEFQPVFVQFDRMRIKVKDLLWQKIEDERTRVNMIANIAHDFKTPVTSIQGYAQGILDGVANTREREERYLQTIIQKSRELSHMADELSLFSSLETHTVTMDRMPVSASVFLSDVLTEMDSDFPALHLTLLESLPPEVKIHVDPVQCRRIVGNILQNSVKYRRGEQVNVQVSLTENPKNVIFSFADDGMGVPSSEIGRIFDRFYRGDSARQSAQGSGLGLSIARQMVEAQGGTIWGRTNAQNGLSIFLAFPKMHDAPPPSKETKKRGWQ